jgi:hypothetical protein
VANVIQAEEAPKSTTGALAASSLKRDGLQIKNQLTAESEDTFNRAKEVVMMRMNISARVAVVQFESKRFCSLAPVR